ncbi:MAG TPA: guanylate kinase, partial [bacterium]|nr:guanylate kinase [bacterium]
SREDLIRRLCARGTETEEEIRKRFSFVEYEYELMQHYNYLIVNRTIERAAEQLCNIILAERCRRAHLEPVLRKAGILPF